MSDYETTQIRWGADEVVALDAVCLRIGNITGRLVSRPEALKTLVRACAAKMTIEELFVHDGVLMCLAHIGLER